MLVQFFFCNFQENWAALRCRRVHSKKTYQIDLNTYLFNKFITTIRLKATDSILAGIQSYATYSGCAAIMP